MLSLRNRLQNVTPPQCCVLNAALNTAPIAIVAAVVIIAAATLSPPPAHAAPPPLAEQKVMLVAREQPADNFLKDFFGQAGLPVMVSDNVRGTVNGSFEGPAQEVLEKISTAFNLVSFYDGSVVYVYSANEIGTRTFMASASVARAVRGNLRQLKLLDDVNKIKIASDGMIVATGAPTFLDQVSGVVAMKASREIERKGPLAFRVFPLKYAWAQDTTTRFADREIVVPGVAAIVRSLVASAPDAPLAVQTSQSLPATVRGLRPYRRYEIGDDQLGRDKGERRRPIFDASNTDGPFNGLVYASPQDAGRAGKANAAGRAKNDVVYAPATVGGARIEADPRMNAVIVRDTAERMPIYADLIRSLDVAPQLIEIQATIIDVDTDRLREIGIQYRFTDTDDRADVTFGGRVTEGLTLSPEDFVNPFSRGLLASGVVGDENVFSARIAALETEGIARVVSRPQVMTLANVEAVFDNTRTFFVRVAGAVDVDLFNISVGTTLSVTPHILEETGAPHIKLLVNVEDGQLTGGEVDDIPIIERSSVNTQALVGAEESLLIGGLTVESSEAFEDKVPFLGDIPLLGRLFKSRSSRRGRIERLFLITPRLTTAGDGQRIADELAATSGPRFTLGADRGVFDDQKLSVISQTLGRRREARKPLSPSDVLSPGEAALLAAIETKDPIVLSQRAIDCMVRKPQSNRCARVR